MKDKYAFHIEKKPPKKKESENELLFVDPLGLEPRLFWTKTRRVASYTMGHSINYFRK